MPLSDYGVHLKGLHPPACNITLISIVMAKITFISSETIEGAREGGHIAGTAPFENGVDDLGFWGKF